MSLECSGERAPFSASKSPRHVMAASWRPVASSIFASERARLRRSRAALSPSSFTSPSMSCACAASLSVGHACSAARTPRIHGSFVIASSAGPASPARMSSRMMRVARSSSALERRPFSEASAKAARSAAVPGASLVSAGAALAVSVLGAAPSARGSGVGALVSSDMVWKSGCYQWRHRGTWRGNSLP